MAIRIYGGYETNELPTEETRLLDAARLKEMGYVAVLGVDMFSDGDLHRMINSEIKISSVRPNDDDYCIGPYVFTDGEEPFIPYGLCLWKKIYSDT